MIKLSLEGMKRSQPTKHEMEGVLDNEGQEKKEKISQTNIRGVVNGPTIF